MPVGAEVGMGQIMETDSVVFPDPSPAPWVPGPTLELKPRQVKDKGNIWPPSAPLLTVILTGHVKSANELQPKAAGYKAKLVQLFY